MTLVVLAAVIWCLVRASHSILARDAFPLARFAICALLGIDAVLRWMEGAKLAASFEVFAPLPWVYPSGLIEGLLIPLGFVRCTYFFAAATFAAIEGNYPGEVRLVAARALLSYRTPPARAVNWVKRRLLALPELDPEKIAGEGIVAFACGDDESAHTLFESIRKLPPKSVSPVVWAAAGEWLVASAAARGDWHRIVSLVRDPDVEIERVLRSRRCRLLGAIASRLIGQADAANDYELHRLVRSVRGRSAFMPILRRALDVAPGAGLPVFPSRPSGVDPLTHALRCHASVLRATEGHVDRVALSELAAAWDDAFRAPAPVTPAEAEDVYRDIVELAWSHRIPMAPRGRGDDVWSNAARRLADRLLTELEVECAQLVRRIEAGRSLPARDEWREWLLLVGRHRLLVRLCGARVRPLAFATLHGPATSYAVWLYKARHERSMGVQICSWLLEEARAVGDHAAIELQSRNVHASI